MWRGRRPGICLAILIGALEHEDLNVNRHPTSLTHVHSRECLTVSETRPPPDSRRGGAGVGYPRGRICGGRSRAGPTRGVLSRRLPRAYAARVLWSERRSRSPDGRWDSGPIDAPCSRAARAEGFFRVVCEFDSLAGLRPLAARPTQKSKRRS